ncbi:MAG: NUDIX hydrolase [Treponema sp.]|nr:NUDIX hydrolase [Treponema sp.]
MEKTDDASRALIWTEVEKRILYKTSVLTLAETESRAPDGRCSNFIVLDATDWVIVIPQKDDTFLMVRQWRHGERALSIEFPGGIIEPGETPLEGAVRELREETGCTAQTMSLLGSFNPNPALMTNRVYVFLAEQLSEPQELQLDDDEYVQCLELPQKAVIDGLGTPEYSHALMTAALALYLWRTYCCTTTRS